MTDTTFDEVIDRLEEYKNKYVAVWHDVPDHEIVMHPATYADLMDDERVIDKVDHLREERNIFGRCICLEDSAVGITIRDRTCQQ